jgi:alpha-beta hydrolase superfamily lysophospholipase
MIQGGYGTPRCMAPPTLMLYGEKDQVTPSNAPSWRLSLKRVAEEKALRLYPEVAPCSGDLQAEVVYGDVADWIEGLI